MAKKYSYIVTEGPQDSVLKPGKALQVSLQDNRWINEKTLNLGSVNLVSSFLAEVIGLT